MVKIKKAIFIIILAVSLCSCSDKGQVYFISDKYTEEIVNYNIIEEFRKSAENSRFNFTYNIADSEKEVESFIDKTDAGDNSIIILTPFVFVNYYTEDREQNERLFLIGPYFDFNRNSTEVIGNIDSISVSAVSGLSADGISFYFDDSENSFPEMEIVENISSSLEKSGNKALYVTINNISDLKTSKFISTDEDILSVIVPESSLDTVLNRLSEIKNRYILYDFGGFSSLQQFLSVPEPVFVLKYDYTESFNAVLAYKNSGTGKKIVYSCCFEKK